MDERLRMAAQAYKKGYTCSQAVFSAYADYMGIEPLTAKKIMEGFGGGFADQQEVCGALVAATAIISYHFSNGQVGEESNRRLVYRKVHDAMEAFSREYGGITCRDLLRGEKPRELMCGMKVKDVVLVIERVLASGWDDDDRDGNVS